MGQLIQNAIKTPDGTILISIHTHDYRQHTDANGLLYMVDGGLDYIRRSNHVQAPYTDMTVYDDEPFESIRTKYVRGTRGINGDEPLRFVTLQEMSDEHLLAAIEWNAGLGQSESRASKMYARELDYRQRKQLKMENTRKFKHIATGKVFVNIHPGVYTEDGALQGSGVEKILPGWLVENSNEWKEVYTLMVPIGSYFKVVDNTESSKLGNTDFRIDSVDEDNVVVSWQGGRHRNTESYPIKQANSFINKGWWVVTKIFLFTTDDGVDQFEGNYWFYVNTSKMHLEPRKTSQMEYKGDQEAEIITFGTKKAAEEYLLNNRRLLSLSDIQENIGNLSNLQNIAKERYV